MAHYGDAAVQDRAQGQGPRVGRDPGDILEEAINLWCYFLKLEGDPLAYRGEIDQSAQLRRVDEQMSAGAAERTYTA